MKLWIDEDLSPTLVPVCNAEGYDAASNRDRALLGGTDAEVLARCLAEDRVLVTNNAGDFRALCSRQDAHPGLIVLPSIPKTGQQRLMRTTLLAIEQQAGQVGEAARDWMVNRVVETDAQGVPTYSVLPAT